MGIRDSGDAVTVTKRLLGRCVARPADPCSRPRVDPKVVTRKRVSMLAMRLAQVRQVLGMGDNLEVVRIPAGVHAAPVVELQAFRDRTA
jgi:hypothetical protein